MSIKSQIFRKYSTKSNYKWELVVLLWCSFFLHQGDRQIYNVVIPLIKEDLLLTDVQLGLVASIFTLVYGICVPFAGYAGDVLRRKWIVFFSLVIFSAGTMFTGLASGMFLLVLFRGITTGGGEAFYYPSATSLLGQFHHKTRAMAMSIHQTAVYIGITASGFIAGYVAEQLGWRTAFFSFGSVGLLLALVLAFRMVDSPQDSSNEASEERLPIKHVVMHVFGKRTVWSLSLAFGAMVFVNIGYVTWMPTFLHEKFNLSLSNAGFSSMFYHHVFAFVGVLIGAKVSDKLAKKRRHVRMQTEIIGLLLGAPFIYLMGIAGQLWLCYFALAVFGFFRGIYDSNLFAALFDVIEPRYRSSSVGLMLAFGFIVGALAPVILGWVKTVSDLDTGLSSLGYLYLFGAICIFAGLKLSFDREFVPDVEK